MSGHGGTLRSSGAKRSFSGNVIYKHLAALRPGQDLWLELKVNSGLRKFRVARNGYCIDDCASAGDWLVI